MPEDHVQLSASPDGERLYIASPYAMKEAVKGLPNRRWEPLFNPAAPKVWSVPSTAAAAVAVFDLCASKGVRLAVDESAAALLGGAAASAAARDGDVAELEPMPGRTEPWDHQLRAYHAAFPFDGFMLSMDMGTGKSKTAVGLIEGWELARTVILAPKAVVGVWPNQFTLHMSDGYPLDVIVPDPKKKVADRVADIAMRATRAAQLRHKIVVVVNYDVCWRPGMKEMLRAVLQGGAGAAGFTEGPAGLILDESHKVKAPGGAASKAVAELAKKADKVLALTGTPMPHSPLDLYAQFRAVDPSVFGTSNMRFKSRYAVMKKVYNRHANKGAGGHVDVVDGYQNQDELARLFGRVSFTVRKKDVLKDLPSELHIPDVDGDKIVPGVGTFTLTGKSVKAYEAIEAELIIQIRDGVVTVKNALTKMLRLQQITSGYVRDDDGVDHQVGTDKIEVLGELLDDLPVTEPVVIFARFKHDLQQIAAVCHEQGRRVGILAGEPVTIEVDGRPVRLPARSALNEHSQMSDEVDVAVVQIQSGGVGIDLTRAAYAIYYSLDFSLGNYDQSLARIHRPGQTRPVTYYHLIALGTLDETIYAALRSRRKVVESVIAASRGETLPEPEPDDGPVEDGWGDDLGNGWL